MSRYFEQKYRISSIDEVLKKENAIHLDLDLRLDALETKSSADRTTAEIIARGVSIIDNVLVPQATEIQELLDGFRQGVPAAKVQETSDRRFLSDAEIADLQSRLTHDQVQSIADMSAAGAAATVKADLVGGASAGRNTLKKVSDALDALTAGAPAALDTFLEIAAKLSAEDDQVAALFAAIDKRLRVDAAQSLSDAAMGQALSNLGVHLGQCQLALVAGQPRLMPMNGSFLSVDGINRRIPAAGVPVDMTGTGANGVYFIYASWAGAVYCSADATGHVTSAAAANPGVEIRQGRPDLSLVGMVATDQYGQVNDSLTFRGLASWHNTRLRRVYETGAPNTASGGNVILLPVMKFLTWGRNAVSCKNAGYVYPSAPGCGLLTSIQVDGTNITTIVTGHASDTGSHDASSSQDWDLAEGVHSLSLVGSVVNPATAGTVGNWQSATLSALTRI